MVLLKGLGGVEHGLFKRNRFPAEVFDCGRLIQPHRQAIGGLHQHANLRVESSEDPQNKQRNREPRCFLVSMTTQHAGDGNLHPNFIFPEEEAPEHIWAAADALFREAVALGGSLTGEHGVGLLKSRWLRDELGDEQWRLQREIKAVFDPTNILNPGKVFLPEGLAQPM